MRRGGLRDLVVGLRLHRVHEVRKFDAVLDKEYREIVADQIVIALLCIEFRGKSAYVAHGVCRAAGPRNGRETNEHRCAQAGCGEKFRGCEVR